MPAKKTKSRDSVAIVGAGNVARSLAVGLYQSGVAVTEIITRDKASSLKKAAVLARKVKARTVTVSNARLDAEIVWICVSDSAIASVATQLAQLAVRWKGKIVLHVSGPMLAAELAPLKRLGAMTASFHPMNSFVPDEITEIAGTPFGAEGDESAIRKATQVVQRCSRYPVRVFRIRPKDKVLYHALGAFTSPLMISTLNVAERIGHAIRVKDARGIMTPILLETLHRFLMQGTTGAFSGPVRRGDAATLRKHLDALRRVPNARETYIALATNAVEHLPAKNRAELLKVLKKKEK